MRAVGHGAKPYKPQGTGDPTGIAATLMTQILPFFDAGVVETLLGFEAAVYAA